MSTTEIITDAIQIEGAPEIPGLTFRHFRGETDFPDLVAIRNACSRADRTDQIETLEGIAHDFIPTAYFDPERNCTVIEMHEKVIGYSRVFTLEEESGDLIYHSRGYIIPQWRRKGIGRVLLHYNESLSRGIALRKPADQPHILEGMAGDSEVGATRLLVSEGYHEHVYFADMVRPNLEDIPDAPLPEGLEVRPVEDAHLRAIWEADDEADRDHWGYAPPVDPEDDFRRWREDPISFQPHLWKIAWDGDQVAGQVKSFINHAENEQYGRQRGYTEFISVRRPWRRRGLARALIVQSLHELKAHGMEEAALGVHTDNPNGAYHLYQSVGFEVVRRWTIYQKPATDLDNECRETLNEENVSS